MKRFIITTLVLFIVASLVTVVYFKNLGPTGQHNSRIMRTIPNTAALIFEFNNEKGFYDIFNGNQLFSQIMGSQQLSDISALRKQLLLNPLFESYLNGQNVFISLHAQKSKAFDFLMTMSVTKGFKPDLFDKLTKQAKSNLLVTSMNISGKQCYVIYLNSIKRRFYIIIKDDNTFSGSFSKELIQESANYNDKFDNTAYVLMSDQQNSNALANVYINYARLTPLFDGLFTNKNNNLFKDFRLIPGLATLTLNYKTEALMLSGITHIQNDKSTSYLTLFRNQQPVINRLKNIFPSTTAYSTNFAVSDPLRFETDLLKWYNNTGMRKEKKILFDKIRTETGIDLASEFNKSLSTEFAITTTRYQEKIAIIQIKDGSKLRPILVNISSMYNDDIGQINYEKVPFYLLGDAFGVLKKPYFRIIDNYLILANSVSELNSYYDMYINRKFLSRMDDYNSFDGLVAERSNVMFFLQFKNSKPLFRQYLKTDLYNDFQTKISGYENFYGVSFQFTSSDKNFYTNFCMSLNTDSATLKVQ